MKIAGLVVLLVGLLVAVVAAFLPFKETVFGQETDCGSPLPRVVSQQEVDDPNFQALIDYCEDRAQGRLAVAGGVALVGVVVGGGLMLVGRRDQTSS